MPKTEGFIALQHYWSNLTDHFGLYSLVSFIGSIFGYIFGAQNYEMLAILLIAGFLDTIIGMMRAWKIKDFNAKGMGRILVKVPLYGVFLISFHLCTLIIDGHLGFAVEFVDIMAYIFLIMRELKSVSEKLAFYGINFPLPFAYFEQRINEYQQMVAQGAGRRSDDLPK